MNTSPASAAAPTIPACISIRTAGERSPALSAGSKEIARTTISSIAPEIAAASEMLLTEVLASAKPKVCYGTFSVNFGDVAVDVGGIVTDSESLRKNLDGCSDAVIFAATAGIGVDRLIAKFSKISPSKAVMASAIGSAFIEGVCDKFCDGLADEYAKFGKCIKPRFSPGYGGFALSAQRDIATLLDTQKQIGLYFTDTLLMIPEKSVTGVKRSFLNRSRITASPVTPPSIAGRNITERYSAKPIPNELAR